jgi:hypothetical protein
MLMANNEAFILDENDPLWCSLRSLTHHAPAFVHVITGALHWQAPSHCRSVKEGRWAAAGL